MSINRTYQILVKGTDQPMDEDFVRQAIQSALNANDQNKLQVFVSDISPFSATHDYRFRMRQLRDQWAKDIDEILNSGKGTLWCGAACARLIERMRAFSFDFK